jgi:integrase
MRIKERVHIVQRKLASGVTSLYLDYYERGKRVRESLNLFLVPAKTSADRAKNAETIKIAQEAKQKRIKEVELRELGVDIATNSDLKVVDYMRSYLDRIKVDNSRANNATVIAAIEQYNADWLLCDVNRKSYEEFGAWLINKYKLKESSARLYMVILKSRLHNAYLDKLIATMPDLTGLTPKKESNERIFLTIEDVRKLAETPCQCNAVKDAFIFSCFTGLRISDIRKLRWSDIVDDVISIKMQKTREPVRVPLSENAKKFMPTERTHEKVFALPAKATISKALRAWCAEAGINKDVTFHVSRHTFATLVLVGCGDLYTVSKLLGHTQITTTQIYAQNLDESKVKAIDSMPKI